MGDPKLSTFIVGMIVFSGVAAILGLLMANMSSTYGTTYDGNDSLTIMNKLNELNSTAFETKASVDSSADEDKNIFEKLADLTGAIFMDGIKSVKIAYKSLDIFREMTNTGLDKVGLGETKEIIKTVIILSVLVIIIVGVIIAALVKWYL
jgi:hypothetical protein